MSSPVPIPTQPVSLSVEGVTKRFGAIVANDAIDLQVRPGECFGLLGRTALAKVR